jgi:hypothetical protein
MTAEDDTIEVMRPAATGWVMISLGAFFVVLAVVIVVGVVSIDPALIWSPIFVVMYLGVGTIGAVAIFFGARIALQPKIMMVLGPKGMQLGPMNGSGMVVVRWSDLAGVEVWRPYAIVPGQRDLIAIGLTDAAADRLGLRPARPDPNSAGHTGRALPFRKHFGYNSAHIPLSAAGLKDEIAKRVKRAGQQVDGPKTFHIGVAARQRWIFSDRVP